ncbi:hypothetical protein DB88DRAFT_520905 [Papiliotrema laurentii]|uniref:Uncharacterized protein n=1 Tax=Papiliotrema laurentii TaxID=5418 RepID=A0AAD9FTQ6_PAPLA|nr:hypothetical protein DB88DRAFT_520905 [Papiliotrema laurentii]
MMKMITAVTLFHCLLLLPGEAIARPAFGDISVVPERQGAVHHQIGSRDGILSAPFHSENHIASRQNAEKFGGGNRFGGGGSRGGFGGGGFSGGKGKGGKEGKGGGGGGGTGGTGKGGNGGNGNGGNGGNGGGGGAGGGKGIGGGNNNNGTGNAGGGGNNGNNNESNNNQGGGAANPVAGNENGKPGPAVPQLIVNGDLALDPSLLLKVQPGGNASAGEAASATSNNNFIGFCNGKTLTNGLQVKGGSCAVTPLGDIPSTNNLVSTFFTKPKMGEKIPVRTTFTVSLAAQGMVLGSFTNAKSTYYAAPQQLSGGKVVGHVHFVIQRMQSPTSTAVLDPGVFEFFKGLDFGDVNGESSVDVVGGLDAGAFRVCTIVSNSNHASVIMPVAQRGAENTCSYFQVG